MNIQRRRQRRRGNVLVLTALMMVVMFGILAFAVDLGYLHVVRTQLQDSADAAALACAWDLIDQGALSGNANPATTMNLARATAGQYAALNPAAGASPTLAPEDVQIGYLANPSDPSLPMSFADPSRFNAVRVLVRRTADENGEVALFFARVIGKDSAASWAEATAALLNNIKGFRAPPPNTGLAFLPLALDEQTWNARYADGTDNFTWNPKTHEVTSGSDQIPEVNLFPQGTGSPGNRGTVDIGSNNNSTADIARQILYGVSAADLAHHGGSLQLVNGQLFLNGDTGISAGVKDELASIRGKPVIVPIFREVTGNGNNAYYTIVKFVGVCIVEVNLTGNMNSKRVMIQPAPVKVVGAIPASGDAQESQFVYSPVWLVR
jgi:Flp pilus assembly protein TadG